jgi:hypothetical protein
VTERKEGRSRLVTCESEAGGVLSVRRGDGEVRSETLSHVFILEGVYRALPGLLWASAFFSRWTKMDVFLEVGRL